MSAPPGPARRRREPPRRRRRLGPALLLLLLGAAVFALGVGLGQALHDGSGADGTITHVRTLAPSGLVPEPDTVTVTVTTG